jgi:hypothetical protein
MPGHGSDPVYASSSGAEVSAATGTAEAVEEGWRSACVVVAVGVVGTVTGALGVGLLVDVSVGTGVDEGAEGSDVGVGVPVTGGVGGSGLGDVVGVGDPVGSGVGVPFDAGVPDGVGTGVSVRVGHGYSFEVITRYGVPMSAL